MLLFSSSRLKMRGKTGFLRPIDVGGSEVQLRFDEAALSANHTEVGFKIGYISAFSI